MNLVIKSEDELDDMASFERFPDLSRDDGRGHYFGCDFPYSRLKRWLRSKVGQNIDMVISDFCHAEWIPKAQRTVAKFKEMVETSTFEKGGKIYYNSRYNTEPQLVDGHTHFRGYLFYVNPRSRALEYFKRTPEDYKAIHQQELDKRVRILGNYHQLYKQDGIWYEVKGEKTDTEFGRFPYSYNYRRKPTDILLENPSAWSQQSNKYPYIKIVLKRQLNGKELKKFGLKND